MVDEKYFNLVDENSQKATLASPAKPRSKPANAAEDVDPEVDLQRWRYGVDTWTISEANEHLKIRGYFGWELINVIRAEEHLEGKYHFFWKKRMDAETARKMKMAVANSPSQEQTEGE